MGCISIVACVQRSVTKWRIKEKEAVLKNEAQAFVLVTGRTNPEYLTPDREKVSRVD